MIGIINLCTYHQIKISASYEKNKVIKGIEQTGGKKQEKSSNARQNYSYYASIVA